MKIINLTAHEINEVTSKQTFQSSGRVARVKSSTVKVGVYLGCPVYSSTFGEVEGLPEPTKDIIYIVSSLVLNASNRDDLVAPGNLCRDEKGQPVGCVGFRSR